MGYTLQVNVPTLGQGVEVEIPGVGLVENGSSVEVTSEQEAAFEAHHGVALGDANFQEGIDLHSAGAKKKTASPEPKTTGEGEK